MLCQASQLFSFEDQFPANVREKIMQQDIDSLYGCHQLAQSIDENVYANQACVISTQLINEGKIDIGLKCLTYAERFYVPESLILLDRIARNLSNKIPAEICSKIQANFSKLGKSLNELHVIYDNMFGNNIRRLTLPAAHPLNYIVGGLKNILFENKRKFSIISSINISYNDPIYSNIMLESNQSLVPLIVTNSKTSIKKICKVS